MLRPNGGSQDSASANPNQWLEGMDQVLIHALFYVFCSNGGSLG